MSNNEERADWLSVSLGVVCVLLIACNIALMKKSKREAFTRQKLEIENSKLKLGKKKRRNSMIERALIAKSSQEMEFRFLRHALEEALEHYKKNEHKKVIATLEGDYNYSALPMAYYLRAVSYAALQQDKQAIRDFSTYLSLVFFSCYAHWERARVYQHMGETELAIEDLREALSCRPDFAPAKTLLKKWQRERGKKQNDERDDTQ